MIEKKKKFEIVEFFEKKKKIEIVIIVINKYIDYFICQCYLLWHFFVEMTKKELSYDNM
jgi:hypothetical protein